MREGPHLHPRQHPPSPPHRRPLNLRLSACAPRRRVNCTFILQKQKTKVTVPGKVGWTLLETAQHHNLPVHGCAADPNWDVVKGTHGEGPASLEDHVVVAREYFEKIGPPVHDEWQLIQFEPNKTPTSAAARATLPPPTLVGRRARRSPSLTRSMRRSRLAACITLTKDLDGITVVVPATNVHMTNCATPRSPPPSPSPRRRLTAAHVARRAQIRDGRPRHIGEGISSEGPEVRRVTNLIGGADVSVSVVAAQLL